MNCGFLAEQQCSRVSAENFSGAAWGGGRGQRKKDQKKAKKTENSTLSLFREGQRKKRPTNSKKTPKNSTFKPLSTIFVPFIKIQGGHDPLPLATNAHGCVAFFIFMQHLAKIRLPVAFNVTQKRFDMAGYTCGRCESLTSNPWSAKVLHSVANGSPTLQHSFASCFSDRFIALLPGTMLERYGPSTRYTFSIIQRA